MMHANTSVAAFLSEAGTSSWETDLMTPDTAPATSNPHTGTSECSLSTSTPTGPLTSDRIWCGFSEDDHKAQWAGRLAKSKQNGFDAKIQDLEAQIKALKSRKSQWTEREDAAIMQGRTANETTSAKIARAMQFKLPGELRNETYRRHWESYDRDWLERGLAYQTHSRTEKKLKDDLILQPERVGYKTAFEALSIAYSVVGLALSIPTRNGVPWITTPEHVFQASWGRVGERLQIDPYKLNIKPLDHTNSIHFTLDNFRDWEVLPYFPSSETKLILTGTLKYGSKREISLKVTTKGFGSDYKVDMFLEDFRHVYDLLVSIGADLHLILGIPAEGYPQEAHVELHKLYQLRSDQWAGEIVRSIAEEVG